MEQKKEKKKKKEQLIERKGHDGRFNSNHTIITLNINSLNIQFNTKIFIMNKKKDSTICCLQDTLQI